MIYDKFAILLLNDPKYFQVSCSDVRERFHLFALLFVVVVQTMKEYGWREESFWSLAPDCLLVLGAEILVDWIKHAFVTRFNDLPAEVYHDYTISLAYDLAQTKQKYAFSDHSDIVTRRMGFIPLPLGVVMLRVVYSSVKSTNPGAWAVAVMAYLCLLTFRILGSIVILGKACDLIDEHKVKQEADRKESGGSPVKTFKTSKASSGNKKSADLANKTSENDSMFESDNQNVFLFQTASEDREDVVLATMNSTMLHEEDRVVDLGSVEDVHCLVVEDQEQETLTPTRFSVEVVNGSLLGPALEAATSVFSTDQDKQEGEGAKVEAGSLVRSHSSPDLVTEGSGDDWAVDSVEIGETQRPGTEAGPGNTED